ncbi:tRNA pseudouridine(38-40) synthase TruA [Oligoflexus tunisiensis]|uniref:tRNA pseudouridine(38-40) synthase TruA n=1 Tax=Oligoflexus tunisiensis TaxID=708132 RepID=UPI00114CC314|nr:tRNA pseudouridine(38-40) synthase TruA [Oligoflexus tunisiensis]
MESPLASKDSAESGSLAPFFTYRMDLAYIGSAFQGWQSQPSGQTVQDVLEKALRTALRQELRVMGASRTDTGVHAEHQVATFRSREPINCELVLRSLQALVPPTIGVLELRPWATDFHPILSAKSKVYRYRIWLGTPQNPFTRPYVWSMHHALDLAALEEAARNLLGTHDFRSFCASDASVVTYDRTILDVRWVQRGPLLEFYILGDGFLKQMVRSLVGTLVKVGLGKLKPDDIKTILSAQDRRQAGQTAPAHGLSLLRIFYDVTEKIPESLISSGSEFGFSLSLSESPAGV